MKIRRNQWKNIIEHCNSRPLGQSAEQCLTEHDIPVRTYYGWQEKLRQEACDQMKGAKLPSTNQDTGVNFACQQSAVYGTALQLIAFPDIF